MSSAGLLGSGSIDKLQDRAMSGLFGDITARDYLDIMITLQDVADLQ